MTVTVTVTGLYSSRSLGTRSTIYRAACEGTTIQTNDRDDDDLPEDSVRNKREYKNVAVESASIDHVIFATTDSFFDVCTGASGRMSVSSTLLLVLWHATFNAAGG